MNAFDLNRKEYIRVNNNNGDTLPSFNKVQFVTSFVITADVAKPLPAVFNSGTVITSNENLIGNAEATCFDFYGADYGYACYISEMGVINSGVNVNLPYAKVNVYAMDGASL